jgi:predicted SAM-dependent methyltransferase
MDEAEANFQFWRFPRKLNLGCGFDVRPGYLNIDACSFHKPDLVADILDLPMLPSDHYDEILAQDVLEHLPRWATRRALCEWNRLLTPAGVLTIRTTSVLGICAALAEPGNQSPARQERLLQCMFGTQHYSGDTHCTGFTELLLRAYLATEGFNVLDLAVKDGWLFEVNAQKCRAAKSAELFRRLRAIEALADARDFVMQCYVTILGRQADEGGLQWHVAQLEAGAVDRRTAVNLLLDSEERKSLEPL